MMQLDALEAALPGWLETRRWFADKGRGITTAEIEDALIEAVEDDTLLLTIVRVAFRSGDASRYFVPLAWIGRAGGAKVITPMPAGGEAGAFIEAVETPWFGRWLTTAMARPSERTQGAWEFTSPSTATAVLASAGQTPPMVMRGEQSNTSIRYGEAAMVKLVRRLQPGPNPDEEMLRALARVGFASVPPYLGGAAWRASDGRAYPVALAQAFVPNLGDGWSWMQQRLREMPNAASAAGPGQNSPERVLGQRTAEMHVALSRLTEAGLAPEPVNEEAVEEENRRVRDAVDETVSLLHEAEAGLSAPLRSSLPSIVTGLRNASSRAEGFRAEAETQRIRVHGDYHLGQTLRTPDEDWVIIDFEGEPARPVAERRQRFSALKDVAGMLRSFAYLRGAVERAQTGDPEVVSKWESSARNAFLSGYREAVRLAPAPLVPADEESFMTALAAWELDKALYEVAYEVRNRPDWVELPLRSLLP